MQRPKEPDSASPHRLDDSKLGKFDTKGKTNIFQMILMSGHRTFCSYVNAAVLNFKKIN